MNKCLSENTSLKRSRQSAIQGAAENLKAEQNTKQEKEQIKKEHFNDFLFAHWETEVRTNRRAPLKTNHKIKQKPE